MSDSDEDLMPSNVHKYQRDLTAINGNLNFNNTNTTSYTFRNNMMTSTFNMANMERQRYGIRGFDQRSMYCRRETSPMSLRSFPDTGIQNYHSSLYTRGMSSQRSVYNGRSGSPVSMRSIDSNTSVISAADIASALKNAKFNKYDLRVIKEAYNKLMKNKVRKKIEKRRNLKLFLKSNRKRSGDDSGEQGSDSSISSDDCPSSRTIIHKENIPRSISRPLNTNDISHFRTSLKESGMYKDCTENFKQNSLRNMVTVNSFNHNHTIQEKTVNTSVVTLKERFTKGSSFLLPSQRFNKSKTMSNETLTQNIPYDSSNKNNHCVVTDNNRNYDTDSEKEEIFSENTSNVNTQQNSIKQRKRILEIEETNASDRKRNKTTISPIKMNDCLESNNGNNMQKKDFQFKKPQMPTLRKTSVVKKDLIPEILIAKSRQPLIGSLEIDIPASKVPEPSNFDDRQVLELQTKNSLQNAKDLERDCLNQTEITYNSTTDVSMKPSFLKRKLFTQKLDVAESKNMSNDNLATNSPQNKIYNASREKNKVRKLVSSQSCLSRDVGEDNVLDLIHKIVPLDQMNITAATNKKELNRSNHESNDKWDVASVISMCNNDEGSDTYTDEEIFKISQNTNKTNTKQVNNSLLTTDKQTTVKSKRNDVQTKPVNQNNNKKKIITPPCQVVVQKLQPNSNNCNYDTNKLNEPQCHNKRTVSSCVKSFWDTDFESDMEERSVTPWKSRNLTESDPPKDNTSNISKLNLNKRNVVKGTILTVRSFQNKGINSSMSCRSDISRISKRKDPDNFHEINENNNEMLNRTTRSKQNEEKKAKGQVMPTSNTKNKTRLKKDQSKDTEKCNVKPVKTKDLKSNKQTSQDINNCNTSRESLRLKQKKEKANLSAEVNDSITKPKRGRPSKKSLEKTNVSDQKKNQTANRRAKETTDSKTTNPTIKNATLNRTRQTPRKNNEKKQLSSTTDHSSLNISNISSRSLRVRSKHLK